MQPTYNIAKTTDQMSSPTATTAPTGPPRETPPQAAPTAPTTATATATAVPGAVPSLPVETGQPAPYVRAPYRQNTSAMEPQFQPQWQEPARETLLGRLGRWVDSVNSRLVETGIAGDVKGKGKG